MYTNPYLTNYSSQANIERINNEIAQLEKLKSQIPIQQPTNLTQNFQIAPTSQGTIRYANNIEEVQKEVVVGDTPFFSRDLSVLWIKSSKGDIKSFELNEILLKDDKDLMIENLQSQINELKGMIKNESSTNAFEPVESEKSSNVSVYRESSKKSKQSRGDIQANN